MSKSKWLSLVLDVNFMTLTIFILELSSIFLILIIYLRASSQNFVGIHQFNVNLSYFEQILYKQFLNIIYLHTTCIVF